MRVSGSALRANFISLKTKSGTGFRTKKRSSLMEVPTADLFREYNN